MCIRDRYKCDGGIVFGLKIDLSYADQANDDCVKGWNESLMSNELHRHSTPFNMPAPYCETHFRSKLLFQGCFCLICVIAFPVILSLFLSHNEGHHPLSSHQSLQAFPLLHPRGLLSLMRNLP